MEELKFTTKGDYIIGIIVRACLLEEVGSDYVSMDDVIRDMTLWIACEVEKEKENVLMSAGAQLTATPEVRKWEQRKRTFIVDASKPGTWLCEFLIYF